MPTLSSPSTATNQAASSAHSRLRAALISSSRSPAGVPEPSPAAPISSVRVAKISRSESWENGRSRRLSSELAGRSRAVKLSWLLRSSSSAAIRFRDSLVSWSKDMLITASLAIAGVPSRLVMALTADARSLESTIASRTSWRRSRAVSRASAIARRVTARSVSVIGLA